MQYAGPFFKKTLCTNITTAVQNKSTAQWEWKLFNQLSWLFNTNL